MYVACDSWLWRWRVVKVGVGGVIQDSGCGDEEREGERREKGR